jgi:hydrogenase nickel incorporation protein HypA/HybF
MHELSIVQALIEEVQKQVEAAGCQGRVVKLRLQIGRFSGVAVEAFRFAFEMTRPGTPLADAELEIEEPAAQCVCQTCARCSPVEELVLACPYCGSPEIRLEGGQDLILESIELEDATSLEATSCEKPETPGTEKSGGTDADRTPLPPEGRTDRNPPPN